MNKAFVRESTLLMAAAALLLLFPLFCGAQNSAVTTAILSHRDGKLDVAKEEIDKAAYHSKTKEKAKTHFHRGSIYSDLLSTEEDEYFALAGDSGSTVAKNSFEQAMELDEKGGEYYKRAEENLKVLWSNAINAGVKAYQAKKFGQAIKHYDVARSIKPEDSTAYLNGIVAVTNQMAQTQDLDKYGPKFEEYFSWLQENDLVPKGIYRNAILMYENMGKSDKSYQVIKDARKAYPKDGAFALQEINAMLAREEYAGLQEKIQNAISLEPDNGSLYSLLGQFQEGEGKEQEAMQNYKKAIQLSEGDNNKQYYRDANFNLGRIHYERGRVLWKKAEDMASEDMNKYLQKGTAIEKDAKKHFRKALPYFENVYHADKETGNFDPQVYRILGTIYNILDMKEKAEKISQEVENME